MSFDNVVYGWSLERSNLGLSPFIEDGYDSMKETDLSDGCPEKLPV